MRKLITVAGIILVAAIAIAWSKSVSNRQGVVNEAPAASATMSPHETMVKQGKSLPVEYWAHPY
jgi:hypothetical protein